MTSRNIIFSLILFGGLFFTSTLVSADALTTEDFTIRTESLKKYHTELKTQVDNGMLTKEEALALWKPAVLQLRLDKEIFFEEQFRKIAQQYHPVIIHNERIQTILSQKEKEIQKRKSVLQQLLSF